MRPGPLLDVLYLLSSVWGAPTGPQVCPTSPDPFPRALREGAGSPEWAAVTAFVDVTVIPMDHERVLANQTVLVAGGRITALGPSVRVKVPAGAVRIDGRGKYLLPGLADMHAHLHMAGVFGEGAVERRLFRYLAYGVTAVRYTNAEAFGISFRSRLKSGEIQGPHLYTAAPITGWLMSTRPDSVAPYVAATYQGGEYDFIDMPEGLFEQRRAVFDSLVATARRLRLPVASHNHTASFQEILAFGAAGGSTDHLHHMFRGLLTRQNTDGFASELRTLAAALQHAGTWIAPTMVCGGNTLPLLKTLQDAGVGLLLGADLDGSNAHGRISPNVVQEELVEMVRAGLSPYQAFVTGTRNVAQYFGKLDSSGTVAVGKGADLVLLNGNPLADSRHILEPVGVMVGGRWFDRAALDQGLLASPKAWLKEEILSGNKVRTEIRGEFLGELEALLDSLALGAPSERKGARRRFAEKLGGLRAALAPRQHETFDPMARVWMREQARQGYPVAVPGVAPLP